MKQAVTLVLGLALACSSATAQASAPASAGTSAPASAAAPTAAGTSAPTAAAAPEPASVDAALATGDLAAARSQAEAASKAEPGTATWAALAAVCERQADLECARTARARQRDAAPANSPERADAAAKLAVLEDMSRGTVEDEPPSTHRAELDRARTGRELALRPAPQIDRAPGKAPPPRERIVKKWYFWVTVLAIAASGAAITAIAVKAANEEQADDLTPAGGRVRLDQGFGIRF